MTALQNLMTALHNQMTALRKGKAALLRLETLLLQQRQQESVHVDDSLTGQAGDLSKELNGLNVEIADVKNRMRAVEYCQLNTRQYRSVLSAKMQGENHRDS